MLDIENYSADLLLWITAVDVPILLMVSTLIWKNYRETVRKIEAVSERQEEVKRHAEQLLMDFKLDVTRRYAEIKEVRDLERKLVSHLLRIEAKLDNTALKTEALKAWRNIYLRGEEE